MRFLITKPPNHNKSFLFTADLLPKTTSHTFLAAKKFLSIKVKSLQEELVNQSFLLEVLYTAP